MAAKLNIEMVAPRDLNPAAYNPRKISEEALRRLRRGIREFGMVDPIVARRKGKVVIGGHQRLRAAIEEGITEVPVVFLSGLSEEKAKALNVLLNNPGAQGEWDTGKLEELLSELDADGFDITLTGFDDDELAKMLNRGDGSEDEFDPEPPTKPKSKRGEVYELGPHRLMYGDATSAEDVGILLAGVEPHLMVTDPPYGVGYSPEWRAQAGVNRNKKKLGNITNDNRADWREAWALFPGSVAYVWHEALHAPVVLESLIAVGFQVRSQIIWVKDRFALSRGHYHWQHEPCWYVVRGGGALDRRTRAVDGVAHPGTRGLRPWAWSPEAGRGHAAPDA